jgi:hypothetical protein
MDAKTAVLFAAFLPPAEFEAFDPPAAVAPAAPTYADVYARVLRGERVTFTAPLAGFVGEPGTYECFLDGGRPVMQRKGVAAPAASPFRGSDYHPSHDCPVCNRAQYVISGFNPDGTHNHTCSAGHTWRH